MVKQGVYIIAEAGVNHNGDMKLAQRLVQEGAAAGANAVKFQTFRPEQLVTQTAQKAAYQKVTTGAEENQLSMLRKLTLRDEDYIELQNLCLKYGVDFLSTPFDSDSLRFLTTLAMPFIKVPSGEITNAPFLWEIARTQQKVVLSTGMATLGEVEQALSVLAYGFLRHDFPKHYREALEVYASAAGQDILREKVRLLHCTTQYPAPAEEANLQAMDTMAYSFGLPVGYSDHTEGIIVPVVAAAKGAVIVEKHFTLDKNMEGPDHKASLDPTELKAMIEAIRRAEKAIGMGIKLPTTAEVPNISIVRKSLVAAREIAVGEVLTSDNLTAKRVGQGISPMEIWQVLGQTAKRDFAADEPIEL